MFLFKNILLKIAILVIASWVMPATAVSKVQLVRG